MRILVALLACALSFSVWASDTSKEDITSCHIDKQVRKYLKGPRGHKGKPGKQGAQGAPGVPIGFPIGNVGRLFVEAIFIDLSTQTDTAALPNTYAYHPLLAADYPKPQNLNETLSCTVIDPTSSTHQGTMTRTSVVDAQGATIYTWRFEIPPQSPAQGLYPIGYYKVLINLFTQGSGNNWRTTPDVIRIVRENPVGASGQEITRWIEKEALEAREKTLHSLCVHQGLLTVGPPSIFSSANTPNKGVSLLKNYSEHMFYLGLIPPFFSGNT